VSKIELPYDLTPYIRDHCLCLHVRRAARALARRYDEALKPAGLTNGQFSLLMSLNRPEPPTMGEVAAVLDLDPTTLTANLKPLLRRGLVEITADGKDKRSRRVGLTEAGRAVLAVALPLWRAAQVENEARVDGAAPDDLRQVLRALS
jgi:DNA-binding MarR family transcriptional regulator